MLAAALLLPLAPWTAGAQTGAPPIIFTEDFQTYAPGLLDGQGPWSTRQDDQGAWTVAQTNRGLAEPRWVESALGGMPIYAPLAAAETGNLGLRGSLLMTSTPSTGPGAGIFLANQRQGLAPAKALFGVHVTPTGALGFAAGGDPIEPSPRYWRPILMNITADLGPQGQAEVCAQGFGFTAPSRRAIVPHRIAEGADTIGLSAGSPGASPSTRVDDLRLLRGTTDLCPQPSAFHLSVAGTAGNAGWSVSPVTVGGQCQAGYWRPILMNISAYHVPQAQPDPLPYTGPVTVAVEGRSSFHAYCQDTDPNGMTWTWEDVTPLAIDTKPPLSTWQFRGTPGDDGWHTSLVNAGFTCTDGASGCATYTWLRKILQNVTISIESSPGEPSTLWKNFTGIGEGIHDLTHTAFDVAGHARDFAPPLLKVDTTPPTVATSLTGPAGKNGWYVGPVRLALTCADATSGCRHIEVSVDGEPYWRPILENLTAHVDVQGDGAHDVRYRARDVAGNEMPERTLLVRIDATPPTLSFVSPAPGSVNVAFARMNLGLPETVVVGDHVVRSGAADATSGVARVAFAVNGMPRGGAASAPWDVPWRAGDEAAGSHLLRLEAEDAAGNVASVELPRVQTAPTSAAGVQATRDGFALCTSLRPMCYGVQL